MSKANPGNKDWGFTSFGIDELWKISKGKGTRIAVLDSGLNYHLPDFKNKENIAFYNALTGSENRASCRDDASGHGTDCAGVISARGCVLPGVAPEADLLIIKITDKTGARKSEAILKGLEKAIASGSDVISLSFSIPATDPNLKAIHARIREAFRKDIAIFGAAGDSGSLAFPVDNFPASFPECLSVGGIDRRRKRSRHSAKSNFLDLMAPGEALISHSSPGKKIHGTSFATAFAAGAAALLISISRLKGYSMTNTELYDILRRTADKDPPGGFDTKEFGWGILDPVAAMNMMLLKINFYT